jgi:hypothetical protein
MKKAPQAPGAPKPHHRKITHRSGSGKFKSPPSSQPEAPGNYVDPTDPETFGPDFGGDCDAPPNPFVPGYEG